MFTGLTERTGSVARLDLDATGAVLRVACDVYAGALAIGESVAVDGVCLTTVRSGEAWFEVEIHPETLSRTVLGERRVGDRVNLERALRIEDRLGGHLVQGHVDGVATVVDVRPEGNGRRIRVAPPRGCARYLVEKGSVALDGVSLTVAAMAGEDFEVALIPHTLEATTLGEWRPGRRVNVEVDLVAKYVEKLVRPWIEGAAAGGPAQ